MEKNDNIEINRIIDILISKKILITFIFIVFIILGYIYTYNYTIPKYKSTSTLLLIPNNSIEKNTITTSDLTLNSELITTYSNIAKNPKVLDQVIKNLDLNMTEEQLLNQIQVRVIADTYIIEVSVQDVNPQKAMLITKELANVFLKEIKQIYNLDNIGIIDEAETAKTPYNINHMKDIIIFFSVGGLISVFYVIMVYIFDNTIKREEEIERYVKLKNLGKIPIYTNKKQEIVDRNNSKSYIIECINTIRTNILYMNSTRKGKTILITSCTPQDGKSWISSNIAVAFAQTNKRVLLIDSDMRKGRVNKIFNTSNEEGLSNYLYFITGDRKRDIQLAKKYIKETDIPNLHILSNGTIPPNPSELIDSNNMKNLIKILEDIYDIIIVDAPPCKLVTDSIVLSTIADSTILVVNAGKTKIKDLNEVKKSIQSVDGQIIGTVLNKVKIKGKTYSANYYYGNKQNEKKEETVKKKIVTVEEVVKEATQKFKIKEKPKEEMEVIKPIQLQSDNDELRKIANQLEKIQESYEKSLRIINKKQNTQQQIQLLLNVKISKMQEEIKKEIAKIDYSDKFNQINDMIANLKDSYLELSNRTRVDSIKEEKIDSRNIIDIKTLKHKKKKKDVFSINEDITYGDLEKTATCVISFEESKLGNSSIVSY